MEVLIKALVSGLIEKKARTALVLFSIAVSASLIFANGAFARTVTQRFYDADTRWSGDSDLIILPKTVVGAPEWVDLKKLAPYSDSFEYVLPFLQDKAFYAPNLEQMSYFTIIGADLGAFNRHNPVSLAAGDISDWSGNKVIIGKTMADKFGLKPGDLLTLEIDNQPVDFTLAAVAEPKGMFLRELADGGHLLTPSATLDRLSKANGAANLVFLKLKDRTTRETMLGELTQAFDQYTVRYGIDDAVIAAETQNAVMPFNISSVVVIFMSIFIIFTAFNLITLEAIPVVGTLRSVGCTRVRINLVLIVESALLGALGGLIGCVLGLGVLQLIKASFFTGDDAIYNSTVLFGGSEVLTAVLAAVVITVVSAILPILRLTAIPIKNIILNDLGKKAGKPSLWWVAGAVLLAACVIVPPFLPGNFTGMIVAVTVATGALIGLVPLAPALTGLAARLAARLPFLTHEMALGVRNLRDNPSLRNNIQLFSASIAIVAFMASMFSTMGADLLLAFERDSKYDITLTLRQSDVTSLERLAQVQGVESLTPYYATHTALVNHGTFINALYGIQGPEFFDYMAAQGMENVQPALATLNQGRNIITTNVLRQNYGLKLGDAMLLQFGNKQYAYTITGFVDTNLGIGHAGYISAENFRSDMEVSNYDGVYVHTSQAAAQVKTNILRVLNRDVMSIATKDEVTAGNADKVMGIFRSISAYSYLALLVGVIGIVNNLIASFIERRRSFALLRCVGMSKKGLNRMLVTEAVGMGVLGVAYGMGTALLMSFTIPAALTTLWGKVTTQLALGDMAAISLAGVLAMLAVSAAPALRSDKINLIESIKYE